MPIKRTTLNAFLPAILLINVLLPSFAFGMFGMKGGGGGGGGGGSSVAEILAAGLITGLLMGNRPIARPMIQALANPFIGGYSMMPSHHQMHAMMSASMPMMSPYMMPTMHRPRYLMNHALMTQASHHALTVRLNQEIRALEAQESMLEAHLARYQQQGAEPSFSELLREEDSLPAAALLLETAELVGQDDDMDKPHHMTHSMHPEMYEAAGSEPESRYLLPRIVRHFVQRLMRRGEHH